MRDFKTEMIRRLGSHGDSVSELHFDVALLLIDDNKDLASELKYYSSLSFNECYRLYEQRAEWEIFGFNSESHYELALQLAEEEQNDVYDYSSWSEIECRNKLALIEQSKPLWARLSFNSETHYELALQLAEEEQKDTYDYSSWSEIECRNKLTLIEQSKPLWAKLGFNSEKHYDLSNSLASLGGNIERYKSFTEDQCTQLWDKTPIWRRQKFTSEEHYKLARALSKKNGFTTSTYRSFSVDECRAKLSVVEPKRTSSSFSKQNVANLNEFKVCSRREILKPLPKVRNDYANMPDRIKDSKDTIDTKLYLWCFVSLIIIFFILYFYIDIN